jgi:hypothetical protein
MPHALHLVRGDHPVARDVVARQRAAGDTVTVAVLAGAAVPPLPEGVTVHRVPEELSWDRLLALIFAADRVVAW